MKKKNLIWIILSVLAIAIKIFSYFRPAVEDYYSTGLYPVISRVQRVLFGWLPFSIGDLFYLAVIIFLLHAIIEFVKALIQRKINRIWMWKSFLRVVGFVLIIYVLFNLLWGLNYNRKGIAYHLDLDVKPYSTDQLLQVVQQLTTKLNSLDTPGKVNRASLKKKKYLFKEVIAAYKNLSATNELFAYRSPSVKPSLFSYLGNILGYTGYYNPFSGESQVNTTVPDFVQPFTTCHEVGHQLGFAKENEANFAAYMSAMQSDNAAFRYSVYFEMYAYAIKDLYLRDSTLVKNFNDQLNPGVKIDFNELKEFYKKYENIVEPVIRNLYSQYLKANEQPTGMLSYSEVIAWLIAYGKKYGVENI